MTGNLHALCRSVEPLDTSLESAARARLDDLSKPRGSLGRLEDVCVQLFCIQGGGRLRVDPVTLFTVAGDHGVVEEGVAAYPKTVTRQMVANFLAGGAAINVLCGTYGIDLRVVDAGCEGGRFPEHPLLLDRRIADGTANMTKGPAMTLSETEQAVLSGVDLARQAVGAGSNVLAIGEMGIGNTTAASALFSAWLDVDASVMVGPGTGLGKSGIRRKAKVIHRAQEANSDALASSDPQNILAAFGGFEIAMMAGIVIGAALCHRLCVVDGFIAQSAWLSAVMLCPAARGYAMISHSSAEPGSSILWTRLPERPLLHLGMRLGEGTGAALCIPLLRGAADAFNGMATFSGAGISDRDR